MSTDRHSEIELKFDADHVDPRDFAVWCQRQEPATYCMTAVPDVYYVQGKNVVRHRWSEGAGELTCKQRKSASQITDRVEVDLSFGDKISTADVTAFLQTSGWKRLFTLLKDRCQTFYWEEDGIKVCVALYGVERLNEHTQKCEGLRHFLEVEVLKGSNCTDEYAREVLSDWGTHLIEEFGLEKPLNLSLFEIYSKRRYPIAGKPTKRRFKRFVPTREPAAQ